MKKQKGLFDENTILFKYKMLELQHTLFHEFSLLPWIWNNIVVYNLPIGIISVHVEIIVWLKALYSKDLVSFPKKEIFKIPQIHLLARSHTF